MGKVKKTKKSVMRIIRRSDSSWHALDDVDEAGGVGELGQKEAAGLDGVAYGGDAGALELLVIGVPVLAHSGLGLDLAAGFLGLQVLETALAPGPVTALLGERAMAELTDAECPKEKRDLSASHSAQRRAHATAS